MLTCLICGKEFKSKAALSGHVGAKHRISLEDYTENYIYEGNRPLCPVCGEKTAYVAGKNEFRKYCVEHGLKRMGIKLL